jgi:hypothetical protein
MAAIYRRKIIVDSAGSFPQLNRMNIYHTNRKRAVETLESNGFAYQSGPRMGEGVYRHTDGRRAWVDEARYRSFDAKGKHWFMLQVRSN